MSFYENRVLPHLINCACSTRPILKFRSEIVPQCSGRVLEVGMGSGINLQYYNPDRVEFVWGLEPSSGMRHKARKNVKNSPVEVKWLDLPGEQIPLEDQSVDTILLTYTLCTIPDWESALRQMRRVLKPNGLLLFCEHGHSPDADVAEWQERLNPLWSKIAGGCQLNRKIDALISNSGFSIHKISQRYAPNTPKFAGYTYLGRATV